MKMVQISRTVGKISIASALVHVGLLDPKDLPVAGAEVARKAANTSLPSRRY